jgi:hypothetical protein
VTDAFLALTAVPGERAPNSTALALANLARNPQRHVPAVFELTTKQSRYLPALKQAPDAWTIAVKVNDSGDDTNLFGGPARLASDSKGYASVTNNVVQGTRNSSRTMLVLRPNGKPSNGLDGTPVSPLTGGGLLGGAFGIAIDSHGSVWEGNYGWGLPVPANIPGRTATVVFRSSLRLVSLCLRRKVIVTAQPEPKVWRSIKTETSGFAATIQTRSGYI